jgi:hypothetical protein
MYATCENRTTYALSARLRPVRKAVAADRVGRKIIFQIGSKLIAYDAQVRTTELGRHTGDRAAIIPIDSTRSDRY